MEHAADGAGALAIPDADAPSASPRATDPLLDRIKDQLRTHERGIVNPRTASWVTYWDGAVTTGLLYTAIVTPIDVCMFMRSMKGRVALRRISGPTRSATWRRARPWPPCSG